MGLRVALVIEATNGGVARHVLDLASGLIGNGHSVHVVYSQRRIEPRFVDGLSQMPPIRTAAVDMRREPHLSDVPVCAAIRRYLR